MANSPSDNPVSEKYRALKIDEMPIIEKRQLYDYKHLLSDNLKKKGNLLKLLRIGERIIQHKVK